MSPRVLRALPDLIVLTIALAAQSLALWWALRQVMHFPEQKRRRARLAMRAAAGISFAVLLFGFAMRVPRVARNVPSSWTVWPPAVSIAWMLTSLSWLLGFAAVQWFSGRRGQVHSAARRNFLKIAHGAAFAAPPAALGYAMFIQRNQLVLREKRIEIPGLHPDLEGLRVVQLTDIHMSPFLSRGQLERAVAMANETRAHLALVTGDLITTVKDPLESCLDALKGLRADAGVFGCLGNHEQYARAQEYTAREGARRGLRFLRHQAAPLRFNNATLNLAGVDYQRNGESYLVGAQELILPGAFNVLLSHNPNVFPVAARQGYPLTISGHTHGGQVRVEILSTDINVARFYTPYVDGLYRQNDASVFVSRGIGTIGIPARFGAPPEVALLHLCRA